MEENYASPAFFGNKGEMENGELPNIPRLTELEISNMVSALDLEEKKAGSQP